MTREATEKRLSPTFVSGYISHLTQYIYSQLRMSFANLVAFTGDGAVYETRINRRKFLEDIIKLLPSNENNTFELNNGGVSCEYLILNRLLAFINETITPRNTTAPFAVKIFQEISPRQRIKNRPTASRHVLLIRHGEYLHNKEDWARTLTELGCEQAKVTGERLKDFGFRFNKLVSSTMVRAHQTGGIIKKELPSKIEMNNCSLLRETSLCKTKRKTYLRDKKRIAGAFRKYMQRACASQKEDSYDLLVCHANVIRYFVYNALNSLSSGLARVKLAHCSLTWLSVLPNGRVCLQKFGDVKHLPGNLITYQ